MKDIMIKLIAVTELFDEQKGKGTNYYKITEAESSINIYNIKYCTAVRKYDILNGYEAANTVIIFNDGYQMLVRETQEELRKLINI